MLDGPSEKSEQGQRAGLSALALPSHPYRGCWAGVLYAGSFLQLKASPEDAAVCVVSVANLYSCWLIEFLHPELKSGWFGLHSIHHNPLESSPLSVFHPISLLSVKCLRELFLFSLLPPVISRNPFQLGLHPHPNLLKLLVKGNLSCPFSSIQHTSLLF